jgi:uncharacterized protein (DUF488 family)
MLYYRRKIILALLEVFDGQLTAKSLQKYLFLFTRAQSVKAFDFIPYRYGCFSFQANQDLITMEKYNYLEITEEQNGRFIKLKQTGQYLEMLNMFDRQALLNVKAEFGSMTQTDLIRYTYQKYPYFTINSSIANELLSEDELAIIETHKRTLSEPQLFSIGYEGITFETYINKLIINDVHVLCDVRKNAYSQKYGFSKSQLQKACTGVGIHYVHMPELGIESEQRQELHSQADYNRLFENYEKTTLKNNRAAILKIRALIESNGRVALTCFEKNPHQCHRSRVVKALMQLPDINYSFKLL